MPSWTNITAADLLEVRAAKLVEALASKALGSDQVDPTPATISKVVDELRMAIAFSGRYVLNADTATIPSSLKDLAVQRVIRLMKGRLLMALTETEREDERTWQKRIEQLIAGKWAVETPVTPASTSPAQAPSGAQVISSTPRQCNRSSMSGL